MAKRTKFVPVEHTDTERLNSLETFVREQPLLLWDGNGDFPGGRSRGLSLRQGKNLRRAIDDCLLPHKEVR